VDADSAVTVHLDAGDLCLMEHDQVVATAGRCEVAVDDAVARPVADVARGQRDAGALRPVEVLAQRPAQMASRREERHRQGVGVAR